MIKFNRRAAGIFIFLSAVFTAARAAMANPIFIDFSYPINAADPATLVKFIPPLIIITAIVEFVIARWTFKSNSIFATVLIANAVSVPPTQIAAALLLKAFPGGSVYYAAEIIPIAVEFLIYRMMRGKMAAAGIDPKFITNENFFTTIVAANLVSMLFAGEILSLLYPFLEILFR
jgi:hypothetical protein